MQTRADPFYTSVVIFVFRALRRSVMAIFGGRSTSSKFDSAFASCDRPQRPVDRRIWLLARVTEYPVAKVLFWIIIASTILCC